MNNTLESRPNRVVKLMFDILPPALVGGLVAWVLMNGYVWSSAPANGVGNTSYEACNKAQMTEGAWGPEARNIQEIEKALNIKISQTTVSQLSNDANELKVPGDSAVCTTTYIENNHVRTVGPYTKPDKATSAATLGK